ncbi:hypothetical protein [Streptomyces sp. NPDC051704]|uniref:hypothetical protein n=1 Tax=Streptomyces sp. NPDC051704 TaxID=3365671 RepID=UPI0037970FE7
MHRTKPSRIRVLVPSALAVVILSGAAAPAGAADGDTAAAIRNRVANAQQQIEHRAEAAPAAGPLDDLLAGITATLDGLLKSLQNLLPGVTLPPIKLPTLPSLPAIPDVPALPIPALPEIPSIPEIPEIPEIPVSKPVAPVSKPAAPVSKPALPAVPAAPAVPVKPAAPAVPVKPAVPVVPAKPAVPAVPAPVKPAGPVLTPVEIVPEVPDLP